VAVAVAAVSILLLVLVFGWPLLEAQLKARAAGASEVRVFGVEGLAGRWRGSFGPNRHGGELVVEQRADASDGRAPMAGVLELDLDGNALRVELEGHYREAKGQLVLEGAEGRLRCDVDGYGVCRGTLRWGKESMPFALVHMGQ
jgi:hypothetical protein